MRRATTIGAAALGLLVAGLTTVSPAGAAVGDLTFKGCIGNQINPACAPVPIGLLDGANGVAVSPAGDSVYAASHNAGSLAVFSRDGAGALSFGSCVSSLTLGPCDDLGGMPLQRATGVAVSPDGGSVYTLGLLIDTVVGFSRGAGFGLNPVNCLASAAMTGCDGLPNQPLREPGDLALSADGTSLYVVSRPNNSLAHFFRAPNGRLEFGGCVADAGVNGCENLPASPVQFPQQVAVTPDGRFAYLTGHSSDSILRFALLPAGQLIFNGCLSPDPANCDLFSGQLLNGAQGLAISPDGRFLYITGFNADTVVQFAIGATGGLTFVSCLIAGGPAEGCTGVPGSSLEFPRSLTISPDGRSLYVVGEKDDTLVHLSRDPDSGLLDFESCSINQPAPEAGNCDDLPGAPLGSLQEVVVSPDGSSVYGADAETDSVVTFSRSLSDLPPPPEQPGGPGQPGPGDPGPAGPGRPGGPGPAGPDPAGPSARCGGKQATVVGTRRADTLRGTPRRDVIAGLGGGDTIRGRGGVDLICGGKGRDKIRGGGGRDRCLGGPGTDQIGCERGGAKRKV